MCAKLDVTVPSGESNTITQILQNKREGDDTIYCSQAFEERLSNEVSEQNSFPQGNIAPRIEIVCGLQVIPHGCDAPSVICKQGEFMKTASDFK
jgi:hypothetical protein